MAGTLNELGKRITAEGLKFGVHPHMWTQLENRREIDAIAESSDPRYVNFVLDTGHITMAGIDPLELTIGFVNETEASPDGPWARAALANANIDASEMLHTRFRECPICFSSPRAVKFIQRTMLKVKERFGAADPNQLLSNVSAGTCSIPASDVSSGT